MKLLGIESSGLVASVAILDGDIIKAEYTLNTKLTHSETLLPMIDEIVRRSELDLKTIDAVAISAGPGSFTGLRIGAATAKGLCLALDKPIIAVPTLDVLVAGVGDTSKKVYPMMDARRNQVYTKVDGADQPLGVEELIEIINSKGEEVILTGDGVPVYKDLLEEKLKVNYSFAAAPFNRQRASVVCQLASAITSMNADDFAPEYLRKSQAEREKEERAGKIS